MEKIFNWGNGFALSQLAQTLNIDFNTLQKCCCDVQAAIQQVAGQRDLGFAITQGFSATAFQEQTGLPTNVVLSAEGQTQRLANVSCGSSNCLAIYSSLTVTITPAAEPAA